MPKYNQILLYRCSDTTFLLMQITKHQKFDHAWNHIGDDPYIGNNTVSRKKRGIVSAIYSFCLAQQKIKM